MGKSAIADLDLVRQFHQFGHFDQFYSLIVMFVIIIIIELLSPLLLSFHIFFLSKYITLHYLELAGSNRIYSEVIGKRAFCFMKSGNLASLEMKSGQRLDM